MSFNKSRGTGRRTVDNTLGCQEAPHTRGRAPLKRWGGPCVSPTQGRCTVEFPYTPKAQGRKQMASPAGSLLPPEPLATRS